MTQTWLPVTGGGRGGGSGRPGVGGARLARRRVPLGVGVGVAAALLAAGCGGSSPPAARAGLRSVLAAPGHLVAHYKPSQATGWPAPYARTVGGHVPRVRLSYGGNTYRIALLRFGQAGLSPSPVYEAVPEDPGVAFQKTLAREYGRHYTFRYLGGLPSGARFIIESYGVRLHRVRLPHGGSGLDWGGDLYAIYKPGKAGPAISSDLQFIQVVSDRYASGGGGSRVDVSDPHSRAPYSGEGAGLTTVHGRHRIVNFYDPGPGQIGPVSPHGGSGPQVFRLETFLARNTGRATAAGKKIVDIYGGFKWGFAFTTVK
jgi:hypothetical protein